MEEEIATEVELGEDGKPVEVVETPATTEPNANPDEASEEELISISEEINQRHGIKLDVDYKAEDGTDILPDSVEGLYRRDLAFQKVVQESIFEHMKTATPDAYRFYLHQRNGGTIEDFDKVSILPKFEDIKDNLDAQKSIYLRSLKEIGLSDAKANALLEIEIKDKTLEASTEEYLKKTTTAQAKQIEELTTKVAQAEKYEQEQHDVLSNVLTNLYNTNNFDLYKIPDAKKEESFDNFTEKIQYDKTEKGFYYQIPISNENIKDLVELDYLLHNKKTIAGSKKPDNKAEKVRVVQRNVDDANKNKPISVGETGKIGIDERYLR